MYASITRVTAKPGQVDKAVTAWRTARQEYQPVQAIQGLRHTYLLVDRPRGEIVIVGLWDTEDAARAYETSAEVERVRRGLGPFVDAAALADRRIYEVAEVREVR
jgi:heme-degrading monooxygenase HmoA